MSDLGTGVDERPLLRSVTDYPLVTMLIAVVLVTFTYFLAGFISDVLVLAIHGLSLEITFGLVGSILLLILYKVAIRHLGEHPRDNLRARGAARLLAIGLAAGTAIFALIVIVADALGVYHLESGGDSSDLLHQLIVSALFPAISEEMLFRGILFRWIEEFGGTWIALVVSSVLFGAAHAFNPNSSLIAVSFLAVEAGVMLGGAYVLTRSLWLPMGIHAAWNFTQGEVFDIPVSGTPVHGVLIARLSGAPLLTGNGFGLEASPIAMVIATLFGLALLWFAVRKGEIVRPRWMRRTG